MSSNQLGSASTDGEDIGSITEMARKMVAENPKLVIEKARVGSREHIDAIGRCILKLRTFPEDLLPDALEALCHILEVSEKEPDSMGPALASFVSVASMREIFYTDSQTNGRRALAPIISKNLTHILDWCSFFCEFLSCHVEAECPSAVNHYFLGMVATMLVAVHSCGPAVREHLLTDEVLSIAFNVWYHEVTSTDQSIGPFHASTFLALHLSGRKCDLFTHLDIYSKADLSAEEVAAAALSKFRTIIDYTKSSPGPLAFEALSDNAIIVNRLHHPGPAFNEVAGAFREGGAGKLFIDALLEISLVLSDSSQESAAALRAAQHCFVFLFECGDAVGTKPCTIEAVQNGFLRVLLRFVPYYSSEVADDFVKQAKRLLTVVLPPFLVTYECLVPIIIAMRELTTPEHRRMIEACGFKDEWEGFERLLLEFAVCGRLYELDYKDKVSQMTQEGCSHCMKIRPRNDFQRCSECRYTLYCDRQCQTAAWRQHKKLCKEIKTNKTRNGFLRCLAMINVRRHLNKLDHVYQTAPQEGQDSGSLVTTIDYTELPLRVLKTTPFSDYLDICWKYPGQTREMQIAGIDFQFGVKPAGRFRCETTLVQYLRYDSGASEPRVVILELVKPTLKCPAATFRPDSDLAAGGLRSEMYDIDGNVLEAERDDVDEVLEDIYAKLTLPSGSDDFDIWKALDLVLPLNKE